MRNTFTMSGFCLALTLLLLASSCSQAQEMPGHVRSATAVTQVFGDGQKLTAVIIGYDHAVDGSKLSLSTFRVTDRTITRIYTSTSATLGSLAASGQDVVIELSQQDKAASLRVGGPGSGRGGPGGPGGFGSSDGLGGPGGPGSLGGPMNGPPPGAMTQSYKSAVATVTQIAPVFTLDGKAYAPNEAPITTQNVKNLIVDDFKQMEFHDQKTGNTLKYNLFVPKDYDKSRAYPLVLFMPDASATGTDYFITLRQGLGAVVWASSEEQAKHPSFVLAPQYPSQTVDDRSEATSMMDTTVDLVADLAVRYSIDRKRLYNTGQSGGAMMSIAMDIKYPQIFAATFIVAGQWDPQLAKPLARKKLWIVVSEGDVRAYPGENAMTAEWEKQGAKVGRAVWDGRSTPEEFSAAVVRMEAGATSINYVALQKGTVVPGGRPDSAASNHMSTWPIAYTIEGIRDWIFQQHQ